MAEIVNDLSVIKIFWENKTYTIKAEKAKYTDNKYTAENVNTALTYPVVRTIVHCSHG